MMVVKNEREVAAFSVVYSVDSVAASCCENVGAFRENRDVDWLFENAV